MEIPRQSIKILPNWQDLSPKLISLKRLQHDMLPALSAYPWITRTHGWMKAPGPLQSIHDDLWSLVKVCRTDFGKMVEREYAAKWRPRNMYVSGIMFDKWESTTWVLQAPAEWSYTVADMEEMMDEVIGPPSKGVAPLSLVRPPGGGTSMGKTYDPESKEWVTGDKADAWPTLQRIAAWIWEWALKQAFSWRELDEHGHKPMLSLIISTIGLVYSPSVRIDRGPHKPRRIFVGSGAMYIIESAISVGLEQDLKACGHVGFRAIDVPRMRESCGLDRDSNIISFDTKGFDEHLHPKILRLAWQAWQERYGLPEPIAVLCFLYNCYAPIIDPFAEEGDLPMLVMKEGINASGTGAFVWINDIDNLFAAYIIAKRLGGAPLGIVQGDDGAWRLPSRVGKGEWTAAAEKLIGLDQSDSVVARGEFKFLRNLYGGYEEIEPVVFSRARNAMMPEDQAIDKRPAAVVACAYRSQTLTIAALSSHSQQYMGILKFWVGDEQTHAPGRIAPRFDMSDASHPFDRYLLHLTDAELSKLIPRDYSREIDGLFFARASWGVNDSSSLRY